MFVPVILGSDKTTVSVATGHTEYWPLYASIGNIHNNIRRAHGAGLVLVGFLSIPKGNSSPLVIFSLKPDPFFLADRTEANTPEFRAFRRKLFHVSLSAILESLRAGEVVPEVHRCPDGHYRRGIWGIGPYIADYPEQLFLACVVKDWCCRSGFLSFNVINL